ncbi:DUF6273 domain-containing protein [Eggerthellaceae bacterium 24-137]
MFCPKCGNEIAEGSAFCGKCGAPVGAQAGGVTTTASAQGAATGGAGTGVPAVKRNGAKIGAIAAVIVVAVVIVAGFATNGFGLAGVQPKEAVEISAASQGADEAQDANAADGQAAGTGESAGDAQGTGDGAEGDSQDAVGTAVKSAVEAYTWDELSQISAEIGAAGDETAAIEVAKKYNLCTPEGKLDGTQVKSVTLADGAETYVQIVGFAHDDKTEGGKAGITFIFGDCVGEAPMNPTSTNAGGWEASQMRAYLNGEWRSQLPADLDAVIVPVDKLTSNEVGAADVAAVSKTTDSLWLFSAAELCGEVEIYGLDSQASVLNAEGLKYRLYKDVLVECNNLNEVLIKNYQGEEDRWWERSVHPDGFLFVRSDGNLNDYARVSSGGPAGLEGAENIYGIVPGFCI